MVFSMCSELSHEWFLVCGVNGVMNGFSYV